MKYFILFFLFFGLSGLSVNAQTVNGIALSEIDAKYVRIVGTSKFLSTKVNVGIEFGQQNKAWNNKDTQIMGEDGKPMTLNSMIDAMNFLDGYGYEFLQAYAITVGQQNVYHYLMKKKE